MLTLYTKKHCVYCTMVIHALEELNLSYEEKDIADKGLADELVARGGRKSTPYLVDSEAGVEMYGSTDIIGHLMQRYAGGKE